MKGPTDLVLVEFYSIVSMIMMNKNKIRAKSKKLRTTPGIPTWSPTVVLTRPEHA